jgi:hypothetical protein
MVDLDEDYATVMHNLMNLKAITKLSVNDVLTNDESINVLIIKSENEYNYETIDRINEYVEAFYRHTIKHNSYYYLKNYELLTFITGLRNGLSTITKFVKDDEFICKIILEISNEMLADLYKCLKIDSPIVKCGEPLR